MMQNEQNHGHYGKHGFIKLPTGIGGWTDNERFCTLDVTDDNGEFVPDVLCAPFLVEKSTIISLSPRYDIFAAAFRLGRDELDGLFGMMAINDRHVFWINTAAGLSLRNYLCDSGTESRVREFREMIAREWLNTRRGETHVIDAMIEAALTRPMRWPLENVWLGLSVKENTPASTYRAFVSAPAKVRVLFAMDFGGMIDFHRHVWANEYVPAEPEPSNVDNDTGNTGDVIDTVKSLERRIHCIIAGFDLKPCDVAWLRYLRDQCIETGTPLFMARTSGDLYALENADDSRKSAKDTSRTAASVGSAMRKRWLCRATRQDDLTALERLPNDLRWRVFPTGDAFGDMPREQRAAMCDLIKWCISIKTTPLDFQVVWSQPGRNNENAGRAAGGDILPLNGDEMDEDKS